MCMYIYIYREREIYVCTHVYVLMSRITIVYHRVGDLRPGGPRQRGPARALYK